MFPPKAGAALGTSDRSGALLLVVQNTPAPPPRVSPIEEKCLTAWRGRTVYTGPREPLNLDEKSGQRFIKSILHDMMCEVSEVIRELKNSKKHRAAEVTQFDRAAYLEEICDVQKFVLEVLLLSGITPEEFKEAYFKKSDINIKRINEGY